LENLKCLELSVANIYNVKVSRDSRGHPILESLIDNIENTPMLEELTLCDSVIDFINLETLHAKSLCFRNWHLEAFILLKKFLT
jgi:hypothetical protein